MQAYVFTEITSINDWTGNVYSERVIFTSPTNLSSTNFTASEFISTSFVHFVVLCKKRIGVIRPERNEILALN